MFSRKSHTDLSKVRPPLQGLFFDVLLTQGVALGYNRQGLQPFICVNAP